MTRWAQREPGRRSRSAARPAAGRRAVISCSPRRPTVRFFSRLSLLADLIGLLAVIVVAAALAPAAGIGSQAGASDGSVTLSVSPPAIVADQAIELTAVVRAVHPGAVPSGAITFLLGRTPLIGCGAIRVDPDGRQGTYHCGAVLGVQVADLSAVFLPARSSTVAAASSNHIRLVVPRAPTRVTVALAPDVVTGVTSRLTARLVLSAHDTGAIPPKGALELLDAGQPIDGCPPARATGRELTCTVTYARAGTHAISARFLGDDQYLPSRSAATDQTAVATDGDIAARLHWGFAFSPRATRVLSLRATGVPAGATVIVTCRGSGCPVRNQTEQVPASSACGSSTSCASSGTIPLQAPFAHAALAPGSRLSVALGRPDLVGRSYAFLIRRAAQPTVVIACLTPGSSRPGSGCLLPPGP